MQMFLFLFCCWLFLFFFYFLGDVNKTYKRQQQTIKMNISGSPSLSVCQLHFPPLCVGVWTYICKWSLTICLSVSVPDAFSLCECVECCCCFYFVQSKHKRYHFYFIVVAVKKKQKKHFIACNGTCYPFVEIKLFIVWVWWLLSAHLNYLTSWVFYFLKCFIILIHT